MCCLQQSQPVAATFQPQQQPQQPVEPETVEAEALLCGENQLNVVMVGIECAPWSKTGRITCQHLHCVALQMPDVPALCLSYTQSETTSFAVDPVCPHRSSSPIQDCIWQMCLGFADHPPHILCVHLLGQIIWLHASCAAMA